MEELSKASNSSRMLVILERNFSFPGFLFAHLLFIREAVSLGAFSINMTCSNMDL